MFVILHLFWMDNYPENSNQCPILKIPVLWVMTDPNLLDALCMHGIPSFAINMM